MKRLVQSELLDGLLPDDSRAVRARLDLRRVNAWMRQQTLMTDAMSESTAGRLRGQIIELDTGDGHFLLHVAKRMRSHWPAMNVTLVDRQKSVMPATLMFFHKMGWHAEAVVADAFDWLTTAVGGVRWSRLKIHARNVRSVAELEMHFSSRGHLGVCRLDGDTVSVCGLFRQSAGNGGEEKLGSELIRGLPDSPPRGRLADTEFDTDSFCAVAGLSLRPQRASARTSRKKTSRKLPVTWLRIAVRLPASNRCTIGNLRLALDRHE